MKFKKIQIEEMVEYEGKITSWRVDENKKFLRIFAEISGLEGVQFMKCVRFSEYAPSALSYFCEVFEIINKKGEVNFDELVDRNVMITLNQGNDGNFYINEIEPVYDDFEEEDDE